MLTRRNSSYRSDIEAISTSQGSQALAQIAALYIGRTNEKCKRLRNRITT